MGPVETRILYVDFSNMLNPAKSPHLRNVSTPTFSCNIMLSRDDVVSGTAST
jgi:hypothetical protein